MHRQMMISVTPRATDDFARDLAGLDGVISFSLHRGDSLKPPGDVINVTVTNVEVDAVLQLAHRAEVHGPVSVTTADVASLIDTENQAQARNDHDEATWEEAETAMRRHTRLNLNFALTTFLGALVAAIAVISSSHVTDATALVAGAIIAPVIEPVVRVVLTVFTRERAILLGPALLSLVASVLLMIAAGVVGMLVLRTGHHHFVDEFLRNETVSETVHASLVSFVLSACGAVTAAVIVAAGRFESLAGPLVAVQLLPAAVTTGAALELANGGLIVRGIVRTAIDIAMLLVACLIVFQYKQITVHLRRVARR